MNWCYGMKSYRYEPGRAENSIPPDCYFCLYTQLYLPLLLFCLCLSCTRLFFVFFFGCSKHKSLGIKPYIAHSMNIKKKTNKTKQNKTAIPLHSPPSLFPIPDFPNMMHFKLVITHWRSIAIASYALY